jgi:hypothetical protein
MGIAVGSLTIDTNAVASNVGFEVDGTNAVADGRGVIWTVSLAGSVGVQAAINKNRVNPEKTSRLLNILNTLLFVVGP